MKLIKYSDDALKTGATDMPVLKPFQLQLIRDLSKAQKDVSTMLVDILDDALEVMDMKVSKLSWGLIGLLGEMGEVLDYLKKEWLHGKTMDVSLIHFELGDCVWYLNYILRGGLGTSSEDMLILKTFPEFSLEYRLGCVLKVLIETTVVFGLDFESILDMNISKLLGDRYKDGFETSVYNQ